MKRTTLFLSAIVAATLSAPTLAAESVRLVVSPQIKMTEQYGETRTKALNSSSEGCVSAPNGAGSWCMPDKRQGATSGQVTVKSDKQYPRHQVVLLDSLGYSAEEVAEILTRDGRYGLVEADIVVSAGTPQPVTSQSASSGAVPNDPDYDFVQKTYLGNAEENLLGMNVAPAWEATNYFSDGDTIDVVIADTSFFTNDDVPYAGGVSFATGALVKDGERQMPNDDYSPRQESLDAGICDGHGLGVAGTVAATIDNGMAGAGVTNNVRVHAARTMTCGTGFLSDNGRMIDWLVGDEFEGVTPYSGDVGIINMSIGGYSPNGCPSYIQEPIDRAKAAGWVVVVAAGNEADDVANSAPANCDGVVVVGALDSDGAPAWYTNPGDEVDLMTQGDDIAAPCGEGSSEYACLWGGTSFSTPLVAGMMAAAKSVTGADKELLEAAFAMTANKQVMGAACQTGQCGAGVPDLTAAIDFIRKARNGELNTITFALNDSDECEQSWLLDNFGDAVPMCELYKASFFGGMTKEGQRYELVSTDIDQTWDAGAVQVVKEVSGGSAYLTDIDVANYRYGVRTCNADGCSDDIVDMNTEKAQESERPVSCQD